MSTNTIAHSSQQGSLHRIPALSDNYIWIVTNSSTGAIAVIDPGDGAAVLSYCQTHALTPTEIVNTHHHGDHIDGNEAVKQAFPDIPLIAPADETKRIAGIDKPVRAGETIAIADFPAEVIATPGHTSGHVAFHLPKCFGEVGLALVGDTLFSLGCGRVFEGSMADMWGSLVALRDLPDATIIACGHEYSLGNAAYALSLGWDNAALREAAAAIKAKRDQNEPTLPVLLGDEKRANPFLCCDDASLAAALKAPADDAVAVFTALRTGKDNFKG